ncbi:MAG: TetR/AcrR family transcriptional regulator [Chloroflexi bacterium]|nr:TetR/AcrR family transcriptional regulator [Chloroflexota bacterium]
MSEIHEYPEKKKILLRTGKDLILAKGFTATPIDEIVEQAGVTKGAFFHYFKNKEAFARELLEYIWAPIEEMQSRVLDEESQPLEHLFQHIDHMTRFIPGDGRLIGILNQEIGKTYPKIGKQCRGYFQQWMAYLEEIITVAKQRYAPKASFEAKSIMQFVVATIEGVPVVKGQMGQDAVEQTLLHLKNYLNHLFQI